MRLVGRHGRAVPRRLRLDRELVALAAALAVCGGASALLPGLTRWAVAAWLVAGATALVLSGVARRVTGEAAIPRPTLGGPAGDPPVLPRTADREGRLLPPSGRPSPHVWAPWR